MRSEFALLILGTIYACNTAEDSDTDGQSTEEDTSVSDTDTSDTDGDPLPSDDAEYCATYDYPGEGTTSLEFTIDGRLLRSFSDGELAREYTYVPGTWKIDELDSYGTSGDLEWHLLTDYTWDGLEASAELTQTNTVDTDVTTQESTQTMVYRTDGTIISSGGETVGGYHFDNHWTYVGDTWKVDVATYQNGDTDGMNTIGTWNYDWSDDDASIAISTQAYDGAVASGEPSVFEFSRDFSSDGRTLHTEYIDGSYEKTITYIDDTWRIDSWVEILTEDTDVETNEVDYVWTDCD